MGFWDRFLKMDRRWVFLMIGLSVLLPLVAGMSMPTRVTPPVQNLFDAINAIEPEGKPLLLSFDFDPSTEPELLPMATAILRNCFAKKIKVILYGGLYPQGVGMAQLALEEVSEEFDVESGVDYAFLGYVPGVGAVVLSMGEDIKRTFERDYYGVDLDSLPLLENVRNYEDIPLVVDLSGSSIPILWVLYAGARYQQQVGVGTTAVSAAQYYPWLQTGQFVGMLGGLKGAAEYEKLNDQMGVRQARKRATIGMGSQSIAHLLIIVLIVLGNVGYFITRVRKRSE
ncbi:hypothetical protein E3J38_03220 [candidate division TA06 bacterium]|uniref:Uncharacterized protein n=1 Tax=candidate division TA06 bacterium TaxID=2250710 RepID=A0A523XRI0_UNCT6|nr:MAG: hypothetical protein E3J38_03220 [candidate division TA06 bacterium]